MPPVHHQRPSQLTSEFSGLNVPAERGSTDHTLVCMRLMPLAGLRALGWCGKRWLRAGIRVHQVRVTNQAAAISAVLEISVGTVGRNRQMDFLQCPRRAVAGKRGGRAVLPMNPCKGRKTQGSRERREFTVFHRERGEAGNSQPTP